MKILLLFLLTILPAFSFDFKEAARSTVAIQSGINYGAGVVFDKEGDIVTCARIVDGAQNVSVLTFDKKNRYATVINIDKKLNLAVVRLTTSDKLYPANFRDSRVKIGEKLILIGNPYKFPFSLERGTVGQIRNIFRYLDLFTIYDSIQINKQISSGYFGGGVFDYDGQFVGVPTLSFAVGPSFLIPSHRIKGYLQANGFLPRVDKVEK